MSTETLNYLDAIKCLPEGATLHLQDVSWIEYEDLVERRDEVSHVRLSYDQGRLEIMSPSAEHEDYARLFEHLIAILTEELNLEFASRGSVTLRRQKKSKGTEPYGCFYIRNLAQILGKKRIDLETDPPPDLAIEIDVSHPSLDKLAIYAGLGVPEVWRYNGARVEFYQLIEEGYITISTSTLFPFVTPTALADCLRLGSSQGINAMRRAFRAWVNGHKPI
jgi:Uma2 family endonuclease